ncbi:hypothetical protein C1646_820215 [Rhizophagus diaphanus]|nr:hypothetical protein C1646_820215 [Rhizophagus diaphanus] [Rhizophagus sp. MUCL 43196]
MSKLNTDILYLISKELQNDKKTLFSLLLVNRNFCEIIVPILWKNPWKPLNYPYKIDKLLIKVIFSHLSKESRNKLKNLDLPINSYKKPFFNYINFCKHLDLNNLNAIDRIIYTIDENFKIKFEIYDLFINENTKFTHLYIPQQSGIPIHLFPEAKRCFSEIKFLSCSTVINSNILVWLTETCKSINELEIIVEEHNNNYIHITKLIDSLKNLVTVYFLKNYPKYSTFPNYHNLPNYSNYPNFSNYSNYPNYSNYLNYSNYPSYSYYPTYSTYINYSHYSNYSNHLKYNDGIYRILENSLAKHASTIKYIKLTKPPITRFLSFFVNLKKLELVDETETHTMKWDCLQNFSLPHLQIIEVSNIPINVLISLIENASESLIEIKTDCVSHDVIDNRRIIQIIYNKCPNLKYLKLLFRNPNILELKKLLINCQYLRGLFILVDLNEDFYWENVFIILAESSPNNLFRFKFNISQILNELELTQLFFDKWKDRAPMLLQFKDCYNNSLEDFKWI